MPKGDCSVLDAKETTFSSRFGMRLFRVLFLNELGTCSQNFMATRVVDLNNNINFHTGYVEIHIQRLVFYNKKSI
jgi:hypothetical protein